MTIVAIGYVVTFVLVGGYAASILWRRHETEEELAQLRAAEMPQPEPEPAAIPARREEDA
jgi:hypothetical protein